MHFYVCLLTLRMRGSTGLLRTRGFCRLALWYGAGMGLGLYLQDVAALAGPSALSHCAALLVVLNALLVLRSFPTEGAKPHFGAVADVRWLPVMLAKHILEVRGHIYGRFSLEGRIPLSSRGRAFFTLCSARDDLRSVPCAGLEHCQAAPMRPMRRCVLDAPSPGGAFCVLLASACVFASSILASMRPPPADGPALEVRLQRLHYMDELPH